MTVRDFAKSSKVVTTIEPVASITATTTGAAVDTAGYRSATVILHTGVHTDGTFTPTLEESDASGSGYATVAAADISSAFATVESTTDQTIQTRSYLGSKRYLRLVMTETVASTGAFFSATILLTDPISKPTS